MSKGWRHRVYIEKRTQKSSSQRFCYCYCVTTTMRRDVIDTDGLWNWNLKSKYNLWRSYFGCGGWFGRNDADLLEKAGACIGYKARDDDTYL